MASVAPEQAATPALPWPPASAGWFLVTMLTIAYIFSFVDRYILGLLIEPIKADLGLTDAQIASVVVSGRRATDLALRLRYGGIVDEPMIEEDEVEAFERAMRETPAGETLYLLPTYTAMLRVREAVAKRGHARPYWESK